MTEEVTLEKTGLVSVLEGVQKERRTAVGSCQVFHGLHADDAL